MRITRNGLVVGLCVLLPLLVFACNSVHEQTESVNEKHLYLTAAGNVRLRGFKGPELQDIRSTLKEWTSHADHRGIPHGFVLSALTLHIHCTKDTKFGVFQEAVGQHLGSFGIFDIYLNGSDGEEEHLWIVYLPPCSHLIEISLTRKGGNLHARGGTKILENDVQIIDYIKLRRNGLLSLANKEKDPRVCLKPIKEIFIHEVVRYAKLIRKNGGAPVFTSQRQPGELLK